MSMKSPTFIGSLGKHGYRLARNAERREWLTRYKTERGCELCEYREDPVALDFDHVDPSQKVMAVGMMLASSWATIFAEVAKCRILCANCHRIESKKKKQVGRQAWKKDKRQGVLVFGERNEEMPW